MLLPLYYWNDPTRIELEKCFLLTGNASLKMNQKIKTASIVIRSGF
jgi:hypothetical protein